MDLFLTNKMRVLKNIKTLIDLEKYIEFLKGLTPVDRESQEFLMLKEFMRFSPEKFARDIGEDEVRFSQSLNRIKGILNKKIKHIIRIEKMNSILPPINVDIRFQFSSSANIMRIHCICIKDIKISSVNFYSGIIYSYYVQNGTYYIHHRTKSGDSYGQVVACYNFESNFQNWRDWKLNQLIYN